MRIKKRKNFALTFLLAILFWLAFGWLVYFQAPANNLLIFSFYLLLFLAVFLTAALILANSRRGFLLATFIILTLIFRYYQIGNLLNILLLAAIILILEIYLAKS